MIEWAILAFAITSPIATAAVKMHAARLKHKKWEAEQATVCPHVWTAWTKGRTTNIYLPGADHNTDRPWTRRTPYTRTCDMCGDIEIKTWDTKLNNWRPNK